MLLQVAADLGRQQDAGPGAEFTVLLVELALKNELLEVDEGHGDGGLLVAALILGQLLDLPFQAARRLKKKQIRNRKRPPPLSRDGVLPADLAEGQSYVGEFLLEGFVHVLLEVRGFDVFDDRSLEKEQNW